MYRLQHQKGYTLIELMIGLLVGLIVLSAVIYTFLSTLRSGKDIVNSSRLNRESSVLADLITGELRRTGYYPVSLVVSGADVGFGAGRSDFFMNQDTGANCIAFSYYDDRIASVADRAFYWSDADKTVRYGDISGFSSAACSSLTSQLNDGNKIAVENFSADLICIDVTNQSTVSGAECMSATAAGTYSRAVSLSMNMLVVGDETWSTTLNEFVKLPNDLSP